jgi:hypothetical protein
MHWLALVRFFLVNALASIHLIFPDTMSVKATCALSDPVNGLSADATCVSEVSQRRIKITTPFGAAGTFTPGSVVLEITINGGFNPISVKNVG